MSNIRPNEATMGNHGSGMSGHCCNVILYSVLIRGHYHSLWTRGGNKYKDYFLIEKVTSISKRMVDIF